MVALFGSSLGFQLEGLAGVRRLWTFPPTGDSNWLGLPVGGTMNSFHFNRALPLPSPSPNNRPRSPRALVGRIAIVAVAGATIAWQARADERVTLSNGFEFRCDHQSLVNGMIRQYMSSNDPSNYLELEPRDIERIEVIGQPTTDSGVPSSTLAGSTVVPHSSNSKQPVDGSTSQAGMSGSSPSTDTDSGERAKLTALIRKYSVVADLGEGNEIRLVWLHPVVITQLLDNWGKQEPIPNSQLASQKQRLLGELADKLTFLVVFKPNDKGAFISQPVK
jgi:hypothetical protein